MDEGDRQALLLSVGRLLTERIRDDTLAEVDDLLDGQGPAEWERELHSGLAKRFDVNQLAEVRHLIVLAVDTAFHNALWAIESSGRLRLMAVDANGDMHDLEALSDGLSGEIWTSDGWIKKFSRDSDPGRSELV